VKVRWNEAMDAVDRLVRPGLVPASERESVSLFDHAIEAGLSAAFVKIHVPELHQDEYDVTRSQLECDQLATPTVVVEDIAARARQELAERLPAITARALARATIRYILAKVAEKAGTEIAGSKAKNVVAVGSQVVATLFEKAELRSWSTLPAEIRMARLVLSPGRHNVRAVFLDR
jgi:hypothetical protein